MAKTDFLKNKYFIIFIVYLLALTLFAVFSYKLLFHDTWEYILMAKKFAGFLNGNAFFVHSLVYSFFLSFFVKYMPSIITMKLVNTAWIALTALLLYKAGSKKTAFWIWVFSPIAWMFTINISPIVPASFFLLVAYLAVKKWREARQIKYFVISALALGLSAAFYDLCVVFAVFFVVAFFYDKQLKEALLYSLFTFLAFSVRLLLDASLFSLAIKDKLIPFPIYSMIRFWGATFVIQLGLHSEIPASKFSFLSFPYLYFLVLISPLLFYLYKVNFKKNKNVLIFLILSAGLLILKGGEYFYYILLAPIAAILLSKIFKKKQLIIHILISVLIIAFVAYPYFIQDRQEISKRGLIIKDLKEINKDFSFEAAIFDTDTKAIFHLWDKGMMYFIYKEDRDKALSDNIYYNLYSLELKPKIETQKIFEVKLGLKTNILEGIDYESLPWIYEKGEIPEEGYKAVKCYEVLCVYEK